MEELDEQIGGTISFGSGVREERLELSERAKLLRAFSIASATTGFLYLVSLLPGLSNFSRHIDSALLTAVASYVAAAYGVRSGLLVGLAAALYLFSPAGMRTSEFAGTLDAVSAVLSAIMPAVGATAIGMVRGRLDFKIEKMAVERDAHEDKAQFYEHVFDRAPVGIVVAEGVRGLTVYANIKSRETLGRAAEIGGSLSDLSIRNLNGRPLVLDELPVGKALLGGNDTGFEHLHLEVDGGGGQTVRMAASTLRDSDGFARRAVAVVESAYECAPAEVRKQDFMDIARSELSPILALFEKYITLLKTYLESKYHDEKISTYVERVEEQFRKLDETMRRLLQFARINFNDMPLRIGIFDIADLFAQAIEGLQHEAGKQGIVYVPSVMSHALGDKFKTRKVLDHLVRNAIRFSPQGGKIIVGLNEEDGQLVAFVRDFGIGIDDAKLESILSALSSSPGTPAERSDLGVGLYTANEIIRRQGGEMWVKSKKGKGTVFYFSIPKSKLVSDGPGSEAGTKEA